MSVQQKIGFFSSSTLTTSTNATEQNYIASSLSGKASSLNSTSVGSLSKQHFNVEYLQNHGIAIDPRTPLVTYGKSSFLQEFATDCFLSITKDMILKRKLVNENKKGGNLACAPVHAYLFPDKLFDEIKSASHSIFHLYGDTTTKNPNKSITKETKEKDDFSFSSDGFIALLIYYMKEIRNLKPDLGIIARLENLSVELLRLESKEDSDDFFVDFYKIIMMASGACIDVMKYLYDKTGYIYPISLPSIHNAGVYYRTSLTLVLPKICYVYFSKKEKVKAMELTKIEKFYEELEKSAGADIKKKNEYKAKAKELKDFFPQFFGNEIVMENIFLNMDFNVTTINDKAIKVNEVKSEKDTKLLMHTFLILSKSIIELMRNISLDIPNLKITQSSYLQDINQIDLMGTVRFKHFRSHINSLFLVEKKSKISPDWKTEEVIKICSTEESFLKEVAHGYNIRSHPSCLLIVQPFFQPMPKCITLNFKTVLYNLAKELSKLHDNVLALVHCDLKPEHIVMDSNSDTGYRFLDFEYVVSQGSEVKGYTKGYHPPEYDCLAENQPTIARMASDVYSLGLCFLKLIFPEFDPTNRSAIGSYVKKIGNLLIEKVLTKMLECNLDDRYSDASQIVDDLDQMND